MNRPSSHTFGAPQLESKVRKWVVYGVMILALLLAISVANGVLDAFREPPPAPPSNPLDFNRSIAVELEVTKSGTIKGKEQYDLTIGSNEERRGIRRAVPRIALNPVSALPNPSSKPIAMQRLELIRVSSDGQHTISVPAPEEYPDAWVYRLGQENYKLPRGEHSFIFKYEVLGVIESDPTTQREGFVWRVIDALSAKTVSSSFTVKLPDFVPMDQVHYSASLGREVSWSPFSVIKSGASPFQDGMTVSTDEREVRLNLTLRRAVEHNEVFAVRVSWPVGFVTSPSQSMVVP